MCGLVGMAGDIRYKDAKVFEQLLIADTFRGIHSTGIATLGLDKTKAPDIIKAPLPSWDFLENYRGADTMVSQSEHIVMGHNRHATQGVINRRNAHPFFVEDDLFGMHNGTLTTYPYRTEFGTDSEATLAAMIRDGERETLESITGAWAFVWYNYTSNTLNFTRNSERPLTLAFNGDYTQLFWASERLMLEWVLGRNDVTDVDYFDLPTCEVFSFTMPSQLTGAFDKPKTWTYTEKKWYAPAIRASQRGTTTTQLATTSTAVTKTASDGGKKSTEGGVSGYDGVVDSINAHLFPEGFDMDDAENTWFHMDHNGVYLVGRPTREAYVKGCECGTCGATIGPDERWRAFPQPEKTIICQDCAESDDAAATLFWCGVNVA